MTIQWDGKVGPASIIGVLGPIATVAVFIWTASNIYTKIVDKIEVQGSKIEDVVKQSDMKFQAVNTALAKTSDSQSGTEQRLSRVETAMSYISSQVQRVEAKLDGGPPAPALPPPKQ